MYPPSFHDCILTRKPSLWNFVESYCFLEGFSDNRRYRIDRVDRGISYLTPISSSRPGAKEYLASIVKIALIATIIFPLLMVLAKNYYRKTHHFVIDPAAIPLSPRAVSPEAVSPRRDSPRNSPRQRGQVDQVRPRENVRPENVLGAPNAVVAKPSPDALDTHIARNFASVRVDANWVLNDAMRFFSVGRNHKLADLPRADLQKFLQRHAVEGRIHVHASATLQDMAQKIAALKREGVDGHKSYQAMMDIIDTVLAKAPYNDPNSEKGQLLRTFRSRIVQMDKDRNILDQMLLSVERGNPAEAEKLAERLADRIIADAKLPGFEKIGPLMEGGWRRITGGHRINVEVLHVNGRWRFIVAQAGAGSGHHRHDFKKDQNQQPLEADLNRVVPVFIVEYKTEAEAKELVKQIALYKRGPASLLPANGTEGKGFYALFNNGKIIDEHNIPFRPTQRMGNCALRSQEEALFYVCQRLGFVDLANAFQDTLEDKIARNAYPALKAKIAARGPKEPIKPLLDAPIKLTLSDGKTRHILPMTEAGRYTIGRLAEIALPYDQGKFSREQALIGMSHGKFYVALTPNSHSDVRVVKPNRAQKPVGLNERVAIEPGDCLFFGGNYPMVVSS